MSKRLDGSRQKLTAEFTTTLISVSLNIKHVKKTRWLMEFTTTLIYLYILTVELNVLLNNLIVHLRTFHTK